MPDTFFSAGDRVKDRDGTRGTIRRVLSGVAVDYCTPVYEVLWDSRDGHPGPHIQSRRAAQMSTRYYKDDLERI